MVSWPSWYCGRGSSRRGSSVGSAARRPAAGLGSTPLVGRPPPVCRAAPGPGPRSVPAGAGSGLPGPPPAPSRGWRRREGGQPLFLARRRLESAYFCRRALPRLSAGRSKALEGRQEVLPVDPGLLGDHIVGLTSPVVLDVERYIRELGPHLGRHPEAPLSPDEGGHRLWIRQVDGRPKALLGPAPLLCPRDRGGLGWLGRWRGLRYPGSGHGW